MMEATKTRLRTKGRIRIVVSALIFCGFGIVFLLSGWDGWLAGQIVAHPKGRPSFVAKASGPHEFAYYVEVFGLLSMGAIFVVVGIGSLLFMAFGSRKRRDQALLQAGMQDPAAGSPKVPGWFVLAVLLALSSFLVYVATR